MSRHIFSSISWFDVATLSSVSEASSCYLFAKEVLHTAQWLSWVSMQVWLECIQWLSSGIRLVFVYKPLAFRCWGLSYCLLHRWQLFLVCLPACACSSLWSYLLARSLMFLRECVYDLFRLSSIHTFCLRFNRLCYLGVWLVINFSNTWWFRTCFWGCTYVPPALCLGTSVLRQKYCLCQYKVLCNYSYMHTFLCHYLGRVHDPTLHDEVVSGLQTKSKFLLQV